MKSYKTTPPSFQTVLKHPWLWISTFFGSGCITPAPGAWVLCGLGRVLAFRHVARTFLHLGSSIGFICPRVRLGGQKYGLFK